MPEKITIPTVVDKLDGLPQSVPIGDLYEPGQGAFEGKFVARLSAVDGFGLANVPSLMSARDHEKAQAAELRKAKDALQAQFDALTKRHGELEASFGEKGADLQKLKETLARQFAEDFDKKLTAQRTELMAQVDAAKKDGESLWGQLDESLRQREIADRLANGPIEGPAPLMQSYLDRFVKTIRDEKTGKARVVVIDPETGTPKVRFEGGVEKPFGIDHLLQDLARSPELQPYLRVRTAPGGGDPPRDRPGQPQPRPGSVRFISPEQARDTATYRQLRAEAEKAGQTLQIGDALSR